MEPLHWGVGRVVRAKKPRHGKAAAERRQGRHDHQRGSGDDGSMRARNMASGMDTATG